MIRLLINGDHKLPLTLLTRDFTGNNPTLEYNPKDLIFVEEFELIINVFIVINLN
jgi:hypothetical protein